MKVIDIENIKIASINNKYGVNRRTGNLFITPEYRDFKALMIASARKYKIDPPYIVQIEIGTYIDIDNCIKPILDALESRGIIDNDKNVLRLDVEKESLKKNQPGTSSLFKEKSRKRTKNCINKYKNIIFNHVQALLPRQ